jgi:hypothetical protein
MADAGGNKVLIDDLRPAGQTTPDPAFEDFTDDLLAALQRIIDRLELDPDLALVPRACPGRRCDAISFTDGDVQQLRLDFVVMEIMGKLSKKKLNGKMVSEARLRCALLPALSVHARDAEYVNAGLTSAAGASFSDIDAILQRDFRLQACMMIGVGLQSLEAGGYDSAKRLLCESNGLLARSRVEPSDSAAVTRLRRFVQQRVVETVRSAQADPHYHGGLKLLTETEATACP